MPIYEYECTKCGYHEEVIQKFSDKPLNKCMQCSGKLQKLISQSSFHLKGSGWYVTDYAKGAQTTTGTTKKGTDSAEKPKKEKKVESKTSES